MKYNFYLWIDRKERFKIQTYNIKIFNKKVRSNRIYNFTLELVYIETGNNNTSNYIP